MKVSPQDPRFRYRLAMAYKRLGNNELYLKEIFSFLTDSCSHSDSLLARVPRLLGIWEEGHGHCSNPRRALGGVGRSPVTKECGTLYSSRLFMLAFKSASGSYFGPRRWKKSNVISGNIKVTLHVPLEQKTVRSNTSGSLQRFFGVHSFDRGKFSCKSQAQSMGPEVLLNRCLTVL